MSDAGRIAKELLQRTCVDTLKLVVEGIMEVAEFENQLLRNPQPLMLASGVMVVLSLFPGLPMIPFLVAGAGLGYGAWKMEKRIDSEKRQEAAAKPVTSKDNIESLLRVELLTVELGLGLVKFLSGGQDSPFLKRIAGIRKQLAGDMGLLLGPVRVVDNVALKAHEYVISLKGAEIGRYEIVPGCELAIPIEKCEAPAGGRAATEPAFGMSGWWIPAEQGDAARRKGFTVVDPVSVIGTHLCELLRRHAHELFTRQDAKAFLDRVSAEQPRAVEDLVPKLLSLAAVQKVLQNLLRERVSIRDSVTIVEALSEAAVTTRNPILLTEYVRQALRRLVIKPYLNPSGEVAAFLIDPSLERQIGDSIEHGENNSNLTLAPQAIRDILQRINTVVGKPETPVVAIASSTCRYFLRQMVEPTIRNLFFIAPNELPLETKMLSLGVIQ